MWLEYHLISVTISLITNNSNLLMRKIITQTQIKEHSTQYLTIALKMIKVIKTMKFLRSYHTPEEPKETMNYNIVS